MLTKLERLFDKKQFKEVFAVKIKSADRESDWAWHVVKDENNNYKIGIYEDKESAEMVRAEYRKLK